MEYNPVAKINLIFIGEKECLDELLQSTEVDV